MNWRQKSTVSCKRSDPRDRDQSFAFTVLYRAASHGPNLAIEYQLKKYRIDESEIWSIPNIYL